jgi:hypothetical protein
VASATLDAVDRHAVGGTRPPTPESPAGLLRLAGLTDLDGVDLNELERRLRHLTKQLQGADALRRRTVRALLVATLRAARVSGAAGLADAAIGEPGEPTTDVAATPFLADEVPWPSRVVGDVLLDTLVATVRRYVVLPTVHAARAIALWVVLTYCETAVNVLPLLLVTSPTKRCGKTRLVELVGALACRALPISNITAAALYRAIDRFHPTLLLDEGDTFINDNPELRGVINAGHTRHTARVIRCVGEDSEPAIFSTWCPKLLAMIGTPADTLIDRSLVITLERKTPGEPVDRLRAEAAPLAFVDVRRRLRRWADDHLTELRTIDPAIPSALHDRAADNLAPAPGDCPPRRRRLADPRRAGRRRAERARRRRGSTRRTGAGRSARDLSRPGDGVRGSRARPVVDRTRGRVACGARRQAVGHLQHEDRQTGNAVSGRAAAQAVRGAARQGENRREADELLPPVRPRTGVDAL